jgi:hypothetical protein
MQRGLLMPTENNCRSDFRAQGDFPVLTVDAGFSDIPHLLF